MFESPKERRERERESTLDLMHFDGPRKYLLNPTKIN